MTSMRQCSAPCRGADGQSRIVPADGDPDIPVDQVTMRTTEDALPRVRWLQPFWWRVFNISRPLSCPSAGALHVTNVYLRSLLDPSLAVLKLQGADAAKHPDVW